LYPHCKGHSQNLEYEKAKVVLKDQALSYTIQIYVRL
jgi:hypothetical protein